MGSHLAGPDRGRLVSRWLERMLPFAAFVLLTASLVLLPATPASAAVPTIDPIADPAPIFEDAPQQTVNLTGIGDGDGGTQAIAITATSGNVGLIPNPTVNYTSPNATGSLDYTPVANASGTALITVTVTDGGADLVVGTGGDDEVTVETFTVAVTAVNDPPTIAAIANQSAVLEDSGPHVVNLSGITAGGGESQTLTVTATSSNPTVVPNPVVSYTSPSTTGTLTYTPAANRSGSATITVTVDDGGPGGTVSELFTVTVTAVNDPPTLDPIADRAPVGENSGPHAVNLSGITAGPFESQTLTVTATSSNPTVVPNPVVTYTSPSSTGTLTYTPAANQSGSATITVTVDDGGPGGTVQRTFGVEVVPSNPTVAAASGDTFVLRLVGGNIELERTNGATVTVDSWPATLVSSLTLNGTAGADQVTVQGGGAAVPSGGFFYNAGGGGDSMTIAGSATTVTHTFTNSTDGTVTLDTKTITYTGLSPIFDNLGATDRVFTYGGTDDTITLSDLGGGKSRIASNNGETVDFTNPTTSLTVNAAGGNDTTEVVSLASGFTTTLNGDAGSNALVLTNAGTVTVNAGTASVSGAVSFNYTGMGSLTGNGTSTLANSAAFTITATNAGTAGAIAFTAFPNLTGTSGNGDLFTFQGSGAVTGTIDGVSGNNDAVVFAAGATPQAVDLTTLANIDVITANPAGFSLTGGSSWTVDAANAGTVDGVDFVGFGTLAGTTGDDTFTIENTGSLTGTINGLGHTTGDTVDLSDFAAATVNAATGAATAILAGFSNVETVVGGGGGFTLTNGSAWSITGVDDGTVDGLAFVDFRDLVGTAGNDTFTFASAGRVATVDGAGGTGDIIALPASRTVDLSVPKVNNSITTSFTGIEAIQGDGATTTISANGLGAGVTFTVTGTNAGTVAGYSFLAVPDLTGSAHDDVFDLRAGSIGAIAGGAHADRDTLTVAAAVGAVTVNLTGSVTGAVSATSFSQIESLTGDGSDDTLAGGASFDISGANSGTAGGFAFSGFPNLTGTSADADAFVFGASGSLSGLIDGGAGTNDRVDYSALASATVNVSTAFVRIERIDGNGAGFGITGGSAFSVSGGDDGTVDGIAFFDFADLTGTGGNDTFAFSGAGTLSGSIDGGAGTNDVLEVGGVTGIATIDVAATTASPLGGTFTGIEAFDGDGIDDVITNGTVWSITGGQVGTVDGFAFADFPTLTGTSGDDTFTFNGGSATTVNGGDGDDTFAFIAGSAGTIDGGAHTNGDTLDVSGVTSDDVIVFAAGSVTGAITVSSFIAIESAVGDDTNDEIWNGTSYTISGANAGTVGSLGFSGFPTLRGTSGADTFAFVDGGSIGFIDGSTGLGDTITTAAVTGGPVTFNKASNSISGAVTAGLWTAVEVLTGDGVDDVLAGSTSYAITGFNSGTAGYEAFVDIPHLVGTAGNDGFFFNDGASIGTIDGLGALNSIVVTSVTTGPVTIDLAGSVSGAVTATSFANINYLYGVITRDVLTNATSVTLSRYDGGTANGTTFYGFARVVGSSGDDVFAITTVSNSTIVLDGAAGKDTFTWTNGVGNVTIIGGDGGGNDTLTVAGAASTADTLTLIANPTAGLDVIGITTLAGITKVEDIVVNSGGENDTILIRNLPGLGISSITVDAGDGNDVVNASSLALIPIAVTVDGGPGNDQIRGSQGPDVLRGGDGNDTLWGGLGVDHLEGGPGADQLEGEQGNDFLAGGPDSDLYVFVTPSAATVDTVEELPAQGDADQINVTGVTGVAAVDRRSQEQFILFDAVNDFRIRTNGPTQGLDFEVFSGTIRPVVQNPIVDIEAKEDDPAIEIDLENYTAPGGPTLPVFALANGNPMAYSVQLNENPAVVKATIASGTSVLRLEFVQDQADFTFVEVRAADAADPNLKDFWRFKVTVLPQNDPPVAEDFAVTANEGAATSIDVLAHVTDKDPDTTLTVAGFDAAGLLNGTLTQDGNTLVYTHDGSETTTGGTFTYTVSDGEATDTATVTITVNPVDDPAVAGNDTATVTEAGSVVIAVLANDTDIDSPTLTPVIVTQPRDGTVTVNPDGTVTYKHRGSERRTDSFTYAAKGGANQSPPATVTITVVGVPATAGLVNPSTGQWFLRNTAGQVTPFFFGNPGDVPFMGDWNCDGIDTPGLYRRSDGFVYLRNSNTQGNADVSFFFGNPGDLPLAGDFNGDGCDTVSIYRPSEGRIFIINALGQNGGGLGAADFSFYFGDPGDKPFVGDFDGDGIDTVGLHRESTGFAYLRQTNTQGNADLSFFFGDPGDRIIAGDWNNDGVDTVAIYRPSTATFYFRFSNSQGNADLTVPFGEATFLPVAGEFGLG